MKTVAFDLGDTLVEYEGVPLNWEAHYPEALGHLATFLGVTLKADQIAQACAVLRRYNTRLHPRTEETTFSTILAELLRCFAAPTGVDELTCATAFFRIFRQKLRCFPDTQAALATLRRQGLKLGVYTDVPYGMPRQLVLEDVREAGLAQAFDSFLTSRDTGYRKPAVATLTALASELGCRAQDMVHVGNERKDIEVARAFGCQAILIDRQGHRSEWGQDRTIASLAELD